MFFKKWSKMGLFGPLLAFLVLFAIFWASFYHVWFMWYIWVPLGLIFSLFWPNMLLKCSISTSKKEITLPSEIWWSSSRNQEMKIGKKWQHHSDHPKRHELNVNVTSSKILQFFKNMSKHYESMNFLFRFYWKFFSWLSHFEKKHKRFVAIEESKR